MQTFPDTFLFVGTFTERIQLIGDAVSPCLWYRTFLTPGPPGGSSDKLAGEAAKFCANLIQGDESGPRKSDWPGALDPGASTASNGTTGAPMSLTQAQRVIVEKARALGGGRQGVALDDSVCTYLVGTIAKDLGLLEPLPGVSSRACPVFRLGVVGQSKLPDQDFLVLFERLVTLEPNADTYFACLSTLHKSRLKYERILRTQPIPTPGRSPWSSSVRKFGVQSLNRVQSGLFDRQQAAQATGYLFEPIIRSYPAGEQQPGTAGHGPGAAGRLSEGR